ncbi:acyltransferase family protein [Noviherbaspirillum galbum]|uniref:Acyltransferase n=1 Tax=Noviherbaspirillum galbum TaxID=2709383 RepID=A0A6B3SNQ6_9BURK|nr:acyltransferase [Noviherbaspirillum galbum]NEX60905.1 acyltransferase [Noviherbaspirillum galbum]
MFPFQTPPRRHAAKVIFADQLRALAIFCVLVVHLLGSYWAARDTVAQHIAAPVVADPAARSLSLISLTWVNLGPLGVSLFFLISGFVIPFSLQHARRWRFLGARMLRIYPTYVACLLLGMAAVWTSARFWGKPVPWDATTFFMNAMLLHNLASVDTMDMVNWSLAVEIKFYLLACLAAGWIRTGRSLPVIGLACAIAGLVYLQDAWLPAAWQVVPAGGFALSLPLLMHDLMFMPFMLIGTLFSFHFRKMIGTRTLGAGVAALLLVFLFAWTHSVLKDFFPLVPLNYVLALLLFSTAYAFRRSFRPIGAVDDLAAISYPVYALHTLVGYTAIRLLTAHAVPYYISVGLAFLIIAPLASIVHLLVEMPTQALGRRLMQKGHKS